MNGNDADEVIREAERTIYHAQWRIWEELVLEHLACTGGLARAPLVPGSDVIAYHADIAPFPRLGPGRAAIGQLARRGHSG